MHSITPYKPHCSIAPNASPRTPSPKPNHTTHKSNHSQTPNFDDLIDDGVGGPEKFHRNHFAQGSCRYAYAGKIVRGPRKGTLIVVKKWKKGHVYNDKFWDRDLLCHQKALELVQNWNILRIISKKYELSLPWISQCISTDSSVNNKRISENEWVLCEEYLKGKFTKFNSNSGYINSKYLHGSIQAFCHWTYDYSNGKYLMCDVQGIRDKSVYRLTDPCIVSCEKGKYGVTDIGMRGILSFFKSHKCNEFCEKSWIKPKCIDLRYVLKKRKGTMYHWQI